MVSPKFFQVKMFTGSVSVRAAHKCTLKIIIIIIIMIIIIFIIIIRIIIIKVKK